MTRARVPRQRTRRGLDLTEIATPQLANRFWSKVDKTADCWTWTAYRTPAGYGQFTVRKGVFHLAHRVSYALSTGPIPAGMFICHRCDNPPCVRPDHLFLGTPQDNILDMFAKGRATRSQGTARRNARLTDDAVRAIRSTPMCFGTTQRLARQHGVSGTTIRKIRAGLKWRHVLPCPEDVKP